MPSKCEDPARDEGALLHGKRFCHTLWCQVGTSARRARDLRRGQISPRKVETLPVWRVVRSESRFWDQPAPSRARLRAHNPNLGHSAVACPQGRRSHPGCPPGVQYPHQPLLSAWHAAFRRQRLHDVRTNKYYIPFLRVVRVCRLGTDRDRDRYGGRTRAVVPRWALRPLQWGGAGE